MTDNAQTNNANDTLPTDTVLIGEDLYNQAMTLILARATADIVLFDQDLKTGQFNTQQRYQQIQQFLAKPNTNLTIILHDANYFTSQCPKLFDLLKMYGHKMTVHTTSSRAARVAKDCFILVDQQHYIRRVHIDHARFKYDFDAPMTTNSLLMRFNELMEETKHKISATKLGL